jgi:hypothetical protein
MSTSQLKQVIDQVKLLPPDDLAKLIKQAEELLRQKQSAQPTTDYIALFGSGKGSFATPAEADSFLRAERDQWEE